MTVPAARVAPAAPRLDAAALHRLLVVTVLGFASGLPLALTGQAMQAWLSIEGVDIATIGFLSLVGLPYTFKFLWAPLMDRFELPWLGRRRGWLVVTQLALAGALVWIASTPPAGAIRSFALLACLVAFISASQDVVIDAYRTDLLAASERGLGSSLSVLGYRLAMILSGGVALIWVDVAQGGGWTWPEVYRFMAGLMAAAAVLSATVLPRLKVAPRPSSVARHDVVGFLAVVAAVGDRLHRQRSARAAARPLPARAAAAHDLDAGRAAAALDRAGRAAARHRLHVAARRLGREGGEVRDAARRTAQLFHATGRRRLPRVHRPLQARRRVRRFADDAVPAAGDGVQHRGGGSRQQGDRTLADDRRRPGRRRADAAPRPLAVADAVRRAADARATSASGGSR